MAALDLPDDLYSLPTQTLYRYETSDEFDDNFSQVPEPSALLDEVDELFSQVPSKVLSEEPEASKRDRDSSDGPALPDWLFDNCEAKSGSVVGEAPAVNTSSTPARFGPVVSESDVQGAQQKAIPANTKKATTWAVNVWKEWKRIPSSYMRIPP